MRLNLLLFLIFSCSLIAENRVYNVTSGTQTVTSVTGDGLTVFKTGDGTLVFSENNTYRNSTTNILDGVLVLNKANSSGDSSNRAFISDGGSLYLKGIDLIQNSIQIAGTGSNGEGALFSSFGISTYKGDISNNTAATIGVATGSTFNITPNNINANAALTFATQGTGVINITSAGHFNSTINKTGTGTLALSGNSAMNINGILNVTNGKVILDKTTSNGVAGSGAIVIGDGIGNAKSATVILNRDEQIEYNRDNILINKDGVLDLNGHTENFNNNNNRNTITLNGGELDLHGGQLDVDILSITANSVIDFGTPDGDLSSILFVKNLEIARGVTLTIKNWNETTDFFYSEKINGGNRNNLINDNPLDINPLNQIVFEGYSGEDTIWSSSQTNNFSNRNYNRIVPVDEPKYIGSSLVLGILLLCFILKKKSV